MTNTWIFHVFKPIFRPGKRNLFLQTLNVNKFYNIHNASATKFRDFVRSLFRNDLVSTRLLRNYPQSWESYYHCWDLSSVESVLFRPHEVLFRLTGALFTCRPTEVLFRLTITIRRSHCSPLFATIRHYSPPFATIRHYSPLLPTVRHHSPLFATFRHGLFATTGCSLFSLIRVFQTPWAPDCISCQLTLTLNPILCKNVFWTSCCWASQALLTKCSLNAEFDTGRFELCRISTQQNSPLSHWKWHLVFLDETNCLRTSTDGAFSVNCSELFKSLHLYSL